MIHARTQSSKTLFLERARGFQNHVLAPCDSNSQNVDKFLQVYFHRILFFDNHAGIVAAENCLNPVIPSPHIPAEEQKVDRLPLPQSRFARTWPRIFAAAGDS